MPTPVSGCVLVIFGASGDLTKRKLIPAIYEMAREKLLPEKFALVGFARSPMSDQQYRHECRDAIAQFARTKPMDEQIWKRLEPAISYVSADDYGSSQGHETLAARLRSLDKSNGTAGNRLFYL